MKDITFANPEYFYLFLIVPALIAWKIWKGSKNEPEINYSAASAFEKIKPSWRVRFRETPFVLRLIVISLIVLVLARPQASSSKKLAKTEGVDIILCMDVSTSMLAEDLKPNRLEAAKKAAIEFIDNRPNDRVGLVIFAAESFTQCPLTLDHRIVKNVLRKTKTGVLEDGTAIGEGLATAVNRLKDSKAKSKIIVILTDGMNNAGVISPLTAAEIAKTFNVRVYAIGAGARGTAPYPVQTPFGIVKRPMKVEIDEDLLRQIANSTGGKYFRATNSRGLRRIYSEIDKMEKTKILSAVYVKKTELFLPLGIAAALLFALEIILRYTAFKRIP